MPLPARIGRPHEVRKRLLTLFISTVGFYRNIYYKRGFVTRLFMVGTAKTKFALYLP